MRSTRRALLRDAGAATTCATATCAATASTVALAGCLSNSSGGDGGDGGNGDGSDGTGDGGPDASGDELPTASLPQWLPAPDAVGTDGYRFSSLASQRIVGLRDRLGAGATDVLQGDLPVPGVDSIADADAAHQFLGSVVVLETAIDRGAVEDALASRVPDDGTHRGFSVFGGDAPPAFAVGDEAVLLGRAASSGDDADKRPLLRAAIDARTGNARRYPQASADCATLLSALGPGHYIYGRTHAPGATFDDAVAAGGTTLLRPEESRVRFATVSGPGSVDPGAVGSWASGAPPFHGASPSVRTDGRTVLATASVPTGDVAGFPAAYPDGA